MKINLLKHFLLGCKPFVQADKAKGVATCSHCGASRTFGRKEETVVKYPWTSGDTFRDERMLPWTMTALMMLVFGAIYLIKLC